MLDLRRALFFKNMSILTIEFRDLFKLIEYIQKLKSIKKMSIFERLISRSRVLNHRLLFAI